MEVFMLEDYYVRPSTVDRVRSSWLAPQIENYLDWLQAHAYSRLVVYRRLPLLFQFAEFTQEKGCRDIASCRAYIKEFVSQWLEQHGAKVKTAVAVRKHTIDAECGVRQMLQLACKEPVTRNRRRRPFPLESAVPGFAEYLSSERGFAESTIRNYRRHLSEFAQYLSRVRITSFSQLSPAVLAAFIVQYRPKVAPRTRLGFCCHLRALLRFCHREGITTRDLSGAVGTPQIYRLNDVPRSITWDEVRRMLEVVERRSIRGRRDYAILLLLVTYGLRAHEIARLTLDDVDWKRERLQILARKAGHATVYPLAGVVAEAIIDYLKHGRPKSEDRHLFFRIYAPQAPITAAAVSSGVALYLHKAGIQVRRAGSHTLRHTCVQRLIDAEFPLKTIGDYVGHRSPESTRIYSKVAIASLREVAMGDGEEL
jgi:integrase/recombinase XerD